MYIVAYKTLSDNTVYVSFSPSQGYHYFTNSKVVAQKFITKQECLMAFDNIVERTGKGIGTSKLYSMNSLFIIKLPEKSEEYDGYAKRFWPD